MRWFDAARQTADLMIELFADPERGGFFTTASDHERLIARRKDVDDHPIPSGNSSAAYGLLRLAALTGEHDYERHAGRRLPPPAPGRRPPSARARPSASRDGLPLRLGQGGGAGGPAIARATGSAAPRRPGRGGSLGFRPHLVLAGGPEGTERPELMRERPAVDGGPAAYVCEHFACQRPSPSPRSSAAALGLARLVQSAGPRGYPRGRRTLGRGVDAFEIPTEEDDRWLKASSEATGWSGSFRGRRWSGRVRRRLTVRARCVNDRRGRRLEGRPPLSAAGAERSRGNGDDSAGGGTLRAASSLRSARPSAR